MKESIVPRFPLFVDLSDKKVVVVGAGAIATRRVKTLLSFHPQITVIAPKVSTTLEQLGENKITILKREYQKGDLTHAFLVVAATNQREVNQQIGLDAKEQGSFVSVADKAEECNFYFPAIVECENVIAGLISKTQDHHAVKNAAKELRNNWEGMTF